jgi:predicted nucleotidyltransferase
MIDINYLKQNKLIIFECISGSKSYNLNTPESDTDIKGVFILPEEEFYKIDYIPQISNSSNDIVYYELKRFIELLYKNNPNVLEMIYTSKEFIRIEHSLFEKIRNFSFLTKKSIDSFSGYAITQVKRSKGLKKKIFNPLPEEKKTLLEYCFITKEKMSINLLYWLKEHKLKQKYCGLVKIPHMYNLYGLYYDYSADKTNGKISLGFNGIIKDKNSCDVCLSSIPKDIKLITYLYYNSNEYSKYCNEYKEYWEWKKNRNEVRYENTIKHKKNYDAKNMMHTFRLLEIAFEIAKYNKIIVKRHDREFLLTIRSGNFTYDELMEIINQKINLIEEFYINSKLPESLPLTKINNLLVNIRQEFYKNNMYTY